jgi:hypothetical protein
LLYITGGAPQAVPGTACVEANRTACIEDTCSSDVFGRCIWTVMKINLFKSEKSQKDSMMLDGVLCKKTYTIGRKIRIALHGFSLEGYSDVAWLYLAMNEGSRRL